jgi:hypothetical protein
VTELSGMTDSMTLNVPRWLSTIVSTFAEAVLLVVTVGIITAMWLPAYLNSRGQTAEPVEHSREDAFGFMPRGR